MQYAHMCLVLMFWFNLNSMEQTTLARAHTLIRSRMQKSEIKTDKMLSLVDIVSIVHGITNFIVNTQHQI